MKVRIKLLDAREFEFDGPPETRLFQLRHFVTSKTGIEPGQQRMIYCGRALTDNARSIAELGIADGNVVHVVERPADVPPQLADISHSTAPYMTSGFSVGLVPAQAVGAAVATLATVHYRIPVIITNRSYSLEMISNLVLCTLNERNEDVSSRITMELETFNMNDPTYLGTVVLNFRSQENPMIFSSAQERVNLIREYMAYVDTFCRLAEENDWPYLVDRLLQGTYIEESAHTAWRGMMLLNDRIELEGEQQAIRDARWAYTVPSRHPEYAARVQQIDAFDPDAPRSTTNRPVTRNIMGAPGRFRIMHALASDYASLTDAYQRLQPFLVPHMERVGRISTFEQTYRNLENSTGDARANVFAIYTELTQRALHRFGHIAHLLSDLSFHLNDPIPRRLYPQSRNYIVDPPVAGALRIDIFVRPVPTHTFRSGAECLIVPYEGRPNHRVPTQTVSALSAPPQPNTSPPAPRAAPATTQHSHAALGNSRLRGFPIPVRGIQLISGHVVPNNGSSPALTASQPVSAAAASQTNPSVNSATPTTRPTIRVPFSIPFALREAWGINGPLTTRSAQQPSSAAPQTQPAAAPASTAPAGHQAQHAHAHLANHAHHVLHMNLGRLLGAQNNNANNATPIGNMLQMLSDSIAVRSSASGPMPRGGSVTIGPFMSTQSPSQGANNAPPGAGSERRVPEIVVASAATHALDELTHNVGDLSLGGSGAALDPFLGCDSAHFQEAGATLFGDLQRETNVPDSRPFVGTALGRQAQQFQLAVTDDNFLYMRTDDEFVELIEFFVRVTHGLMNEVDRDRYEGLPSRADVHSLEIFEIPFRMPIVSESPLVNQGAGAPQSTLLEMHRSGDLLSRELRSFSTEDRHRVHTMHMLAHLIPRIDLRALPQVPSALVANMFRAVTNNQRASVQELLGRFAPPTGQSLFTQLIAASTFIFDVPEFFRLLIDRNLAPFQERRTDIRRYVISNWLDDNSRPSQHDINSVSSRLAVSAESLREVLVAPWLGTAMIGDTRYDLAESGHNVEQLTAREIINTVMNSTMSDSEFASSLSRVLVRYLSRIYVIANMAAGGTVHSWETFLCNRLNPNFLGPQNYQFLRMSHDFLYERLRELARRGGDDWTPEGNRDVLIRDLSGSAPKKMRHSSTEAGYVPGPEVPRPPERFREPSPTTSASEPWVNHSEVPAGWLPVLEMDMDAMAYSADLTPETRERSFALASMLGLPHSDSRVIDYPEIIAQRLQSVNASAFDDVDETSSRTPPQPE